MTTKDAYIAKMKHQLDELNARMERLSDKASETQANLQATYYKDIALLHEQSLHAQAKLEDLKNAGEDHWTAMVREMEKVRSAFAHTFTYFKS